MITDIFVSYSRRDKAFVRALYSALHKLNQTAWVDWNDIAPAVDWEISIYKGIENANKFIFVISPDSLASPYCGDEINYAIKHNKQLVPVLCRDTDLSKLHPGVAKFQIISFCGESDFESALEKLLQAIQTDLEHAQFYIRLNSRAQEWEKNAHHESFLLRGTELASAEQWLSESGTSASELGTSGLELGTSGLELGTSASELGTSASELGTSASELGTSGLELGTSASELGTSGLELGTSG